MVKSIYDYNNMSKTVIYNNNKIEVRTKPLIGKETIFYNNTMVPSTGSFGGVTNIFVTVENEAFVQYDITIGLRWHLMSFYTTVKRQKEIIFSDK